MLCRGDVAWGCVVGMCRGDVSWGVARRGAAWRGVARRGAAWRGSAAVEVVVVVAVVRCGEFLDAAPTAAARQRL